MSTISNVTLCYLTLAMCKFTSQYLVKEPLLTITAGQRWRIDAIKRLIDAIGIRCHSSSNAIRSWSSISGC
jgi:hypothetical protein